MGRAVRVGVVLGFVVDSTLIDCFLFLGILLSYSDIGCLLKYKQSIMYTIPLCQQCLVCTVAATNG